MRNTEYGCESEETVLRGQIHSSERCIRPSREHQEPGRLPLQHAHPERALQNENWTNRPRGEPITRRKRNAVSSWTSRHKKTSAASDSKSLAGFLVCSNISNCSCRQAAGRRAPNQTQNADSGPRRCKSHRCRAGGQSQSCRTVAAVLVVV